MADQKYDRGQNRLLAGFAPRSYTDKALAHLPQAVRSGEAIEMSGRLRSFFTLCAPNTGRIEPGTNGEMNGLFKAGAAGGVRWRLVLSAGVGVGAGVTVLFYYLPVLVINPP